MKEILKRYYNVTESITEEKNECIFIRNDKKYKLIPFNRTIEEFNELMSLNDELITKNIPTHLFIKNNRGEFITEEQNKKYILLEMSLENTEYNILDMLEFHNKLLISSKKSILYRNLWAELWSKKVDYFEYQVRELGRDHPIILNSFSYYTGLAENAIAYVNETNRKYKISVNERFTLQRKRINFPNTNQDYFNPLNYIIDLELRDVASYFKSLFFSSLPDLKIEITSFFKKKKLSVYGYQLLYARLLYPSYYFDIYENIMEGKQEEEDLILIINKVDEYEIFLKDIFLLMRNYAPIDAVDWLIKEL